MDQSAWIEERVVLLKKLWAAGLSASQIAGEIGGVTRNAVVGKLYRMGLSDSDRFQVKPAQPENRKHCDRGGGTMRRIQSKRRRAKTAEAIPAIGIDEFDAAIPLEQRCGIFDLRENTCRWPVGHPTDPGFFFCGGEADSEQPYCAYHSRVACQPPQERSRPKGKFVLFAGLPA